MQLLHFNRLAEQGIIRGNIETVGDCYIAGNIIGNIHIKSESMLTIEPSGNIKGNIEAHNIQILGKVEGDIKASGKVWIKSSGQVTGHIRSTALEVYPGAQLTMQLDINTNGVN